MSLDSHFMVSGGSEVLGVSSLTDRERRVVSNMVDGVVKGADISELMDMIDGERGVVVGLVMASLVNAGATGPRIREMAELFIDSIREVLAR